jgi:hypothetical protein
MRLYTAAPFRTYERVRRFNADARAAGHAVMHDWTLTEEFGADGHPLFVGSIRTRRSAARRWSVPLAPMMRSRHGTSRTPRPCRSWWNGPVLSVP